MNKTKSPFKNITDYEWVKFLERLKVKNQEIDLIDINALGLDTNEEVLYEYVKTQYGLELKNVPTNMKEIGEDLKVQQQKYEFLLKEEIKKQEVLAQQEFMKQLEAIEKDEQTDMLEQIYKHPKDLAKMVATGYKRGLILVGKCGLGKTYSVIRAFKEVNKPFTFCSGFSTILEFYQFLYEHSNENIIFDDVSNLLKSETILDLLKSALYGQNEGNGLVQYKTTSPKILVGKEFMFRGTITILVNEVGSLSDENFKAVKDRVNFYELKLDYPTIIKVLFELAKQPYKDVTKEERSEVVKWIKENTSEATMNLSLRLLYKVFDVYRYKRDFKKLDEWKDLALAIIEVDERVKQVETLIQKHSSVKEAEKEFLDLGLGSRATFYRLKKRLGK